MNMTYIPFLIIAIDQMTKRLASYLCDNNIQIQSAYFSSRVVWNKGISFGLFENSYYNFLVYGAIVISIILVIATWIRAKNTMDAVAWGLIVGGGVSNLWDRCFFGAVLDFISISIGNMQFPIFNFADIAITLGAIMLSSRLFHRPKAKKKFNENPKTN